MPKLVSATLRIREPNWEVSDKYYNEYLRQALVKQGGTAEFFSYEKMFDMCTNEMVYLVSSVLKPSNQVINFAKLEEEYRNSEE